MCCKRSMARVNPSASAASPLSWLPKCFLAVRSLLVLKRMISESVIIKIQPDERSMSGSLLFFLFILNGDACNSRLV